MTDAQSIWGAEGHVTQSARSPGAGAQHGRVGPSGGTGWEVWVRRFPQWNNKSKGTDGELEACRTG